MDLQKKPSQISSVINETQIDKLCKTAYQIPSLKANFIYITPLSFQMQQTPEQIQSHNFEQQLQNQKQNYEAIKSLANIQSMKSLANIQSMKSLANIQSMKSLANIQSMKSLVNNSTVQQIKVKWNSFIKMKNKNYLVDYQVIKKIGKGGFGVVSKVRNIYTKVIRAAKVIKKKALKQSQHQKLLQQLTIMRQLDHPNIIKLYQVYDYSDQYVLILQLTLGGQLYKKIRSKRLSQKLIKVYMRQIIKTLIYLHSKGIVHRDLKPENMLLEEEGSNVLKIIDFGIATKFEEGKLLTDRVGTPHYIAPQIIYKQYNQKVDIWSAGVIFYFMLTGKMPFHSNVDSEMYAMILRQEPNYSSEIFQKYSQECKSLLKLMFLKKAQQRPNASEIYQHEWFWMDNDQLRQLCVQKKQDILKNLRKFRFKNKLQAVVNTFIASQLLSSQQKDMITQIFRSIDQDHNGVLSAEQIKYAICQYKKISSQNVQILTNLIDTNCSGDIQYTQFLVASMNNQSFMKKEYFQKAFAYFDTDHSGCINYQEVVEFLENFQSQSTEIQKMFKEVDSNGDGEIDQEEFIKLFIDNLKSMKTLKNIKTKKNIQQNKNIFKKKNQENTLLE